MQREREGTIENLLGLLILISSSYVSAHGGSVQSRCQAFYTEYGITKVYHILSNGPTWGGVHPAGLTPPILVLLLLHNHSTLHTLVI